MINFFRENSSVYIDDLEKLCTLHNLNFKEFLESFIIKKIIDLNEKEKTIIFRYVGLIIQKDLVIFVFPKYYKNLELKERSLEYAHLLLKVFDKYSTNNKLYNYELKSFNMNEEYLSFNIYGLYKFFINDYVENGIYFDYERKYEINGAGNIDWTKTINKNSMIISNGVPIYTELYTLSNSVNEDNIIRKIHIHILKKVSDFFEKLDLFKLDVDFEEDNEINSNEYEYLSNVLINKLNIEYIDRNKTLIRAMKLFMDKEVLDSRDNENNFFGTREFEYVWQKVCEEVVGNDFGKLIKELDNPVIFSYDHNIPNNIRGKLLPDIIRYVEDKNVMYVLDAKYYDFDFDASGKIKGGIPRTYDVIKQFAYESKLREKYKPNTVFNAFLIPNMNKTEKKGYIEYTLFSYNNKIEVIFIDTEELYRKYLQNETIEIEMIFD